MDRLTQLLQRLKGLPRYTYRVCDDGDGRIDTWESADPEGDLILWDDLVTILKDYE